MADAIAQYVIYEHPADFPAHYVVREWLIAGGELAPTDQYWLADTVEAARAHIPEGFSCLGRWHADDPVIVEVWI